MKVLHIIPTYIPSFRSSGPINVTHALNKWLVRKGVDVTVYTTNADAPHEKTNVMLNVPVDIDGVKVFYFQTSFPRRWYYSHNLHKKIAETIKNFDIVHITSAFLAASTLGAYYAKKNKKPYIISAYGTFMKRPLLYHSFIKKIYITFFEQRNLSGASAIHFVSEKEKQEYLMKKFPYQKTPVILSGVDSEIFKIEENKGIIRKKFNISLDQKIILFLGRLNWIKGLDTLLPAFAKLLKEKPKTLLLLAGYEDGGYKKEVERLIKENNLVGKVIMPGPLFHEEKNAALAESDIFVLPSYSEAASIASIEALFFGLPVIITENCGFAYEIEKEGAGIVIKKDEEELKNAFLLILNDDLFAKKLRNRGRDFALRELTFDKIADRFVTLYTEIINCYKK